MVVRLSGGIPKQFQGELFQVVKIQNAISAFALGEFSTEFLRQLQQRGHVAANPIPVLGQRIAAAFCRHERMQKRGLGKKNFKRLPQRGFLFRRPVAVGGNDLFQNASNVFATILPENFA